VNLRAVGQIDGLVYDDAAILHAAEKSQRHEGRIANLEVAL